MEHFPRRRKRRADKKDQQRSHILQKIIQENHHRVTLCSVSPDINTKAHFIRPAVLSRLFFIARPSFCCFGAQKEAQSGITRKKILSYTHTYHHAAAGNSIKSDAEK